jgi:hypothetical protein
MAKITIYEAKEIELDAQKFYLPGENIGWAVAFLPNNEIRVTSKDRPFQPEESKFYRMPNGCPEITESRFYEILASNYAFRKAEDERLAIEWGLEMHTLKEDEMDTTTDEEFKDWEDPFRQQIKAERAAEERADERRERDENSYDNSDREYV